MDQLPHEMVVGCLDHLDSRTLLRVAQCCRYWRQAVCWPLLTARGDIPIALTGDSSIYALHPHSMLRWFGARTVRLQRSICPLQIVELLGITPTSLVLDSVVLDGNLVRALACAMPSLAHLTIENCSFAGTLPGDIDSLRWDLSGSALTSLRFVATLCAWNEWAIFNIVRCALGSRRSQLVRVELVQQTWCRVRALVSMLTRRLDYLSVAVEAQANSVVEWEQMGNPLIQADVTHLAARINCPSPCSPIDPRGSIVDLLMSSWGSLRTLDLRESIGATDDFLARLLVWLAQINSTLEHLALGTRDAPFDLPLVAESLCGVSTLSHFHVENARGLSKHNLSSCARLQTVTVPLCSNELLSELSTCQEWTVVEWPWSWRRVSA